MQGFTEPTGRYRVERRTGAFSSVGSGTTQKELLAAPPVHYNNLKAIVIFLMFYSERFHAKTPNGRGSKKIDLDEIAFFLLATF